MTTTDLSDDFSSLELSEDLLGVVGELGYERMTPIQAKSIPILLKGKDLVGQSKTGSGKTAAFALPILQRLRRQSRDVQALVLCPTRELCAQVAKEIRRLGRRHKGLQVLILVGGEPGRPQTESLRRGVHIVVGTPGRVLDHIRRGNLNLNFTDTLVLDEADRMLDMGFEEDMQTIIEEVPSTRQTIFFSATYPPSIKSMSKKYQLSPVLVTIEDKVEAAPAIRQLFYYAEQEAKIELLLRILRHEKPTSALVFCNLKLTVAELAETLEARSVSCLALHGDLEQRDRDRVLAMFRNRSKKVLVATDVAARGLDIENLEMVINFDLPYQSETYVHRIGRTGRAGKSGIAVSLLTGNERMRLHEFENELGLKVEEGSFDRVPALMETGGREAAVEMTTISISGGRKDKLRPGDILGALTGEEVGLKADDIGKIEIQDWLTYVAVSRTAADQHLIGKRDLRTKAKVFQLRIMK
jgi:ATP-independent RNA helicase DbpA